jgi:hypothetical protein
MRGLGHPLTGEALVMAANDVGRRMPGHDTPEDMQADEGRRWWTRGDSNP